MAQNVPAILAQRVLCGENADHEEATNIFIAWFAQYANQYEVKDCILTIRKKKGRRTAANTTCNWEVFFQRREEQQVVSGVQVLIRPRITDNEAIQVTEICEGSRPSGCKLIGIGRYKRNDSGMSFIFSMPVCPCTLNFRLSQTPHPIEGCSEMHLLLDSIIPHDIKKDEIKEYLEDVLLTFASETDVFDVFLHFDGECTTEKAMNIRTAIVSIERLWQNADTDSDDLFDWNDNQTNYDDLEKSGGDAINGSLEEFLSLKSTPPPTLPGMPPLLNKSNNQSTSSQSTLTGSVTASSPILLPTSMQSSFDGDLSGMGNNFIMPNSVLTPDTPPMQQHNNQMNGHLSNGPSTPSVGGPNTNNGQMSGITSMAEYNLHRLANLVESADMTDSIAPAANPSPVPPFTLADLISDQRAFSNNLLALSKLGINNNGKLSIICINRLKTKNYISLKSVRVHLLLSFLHLHQTDMS